MSTKTYDMWVTYCKIEKIVLSEYGIDWYPEKYKVAQINLHHVYQGCFLDQIAWS